MIYSVSVFFICVNFFLYKVINHLAITQILKLYLVLLNLIFLSGYLLKILTFNFSFQRTHEFSLLNPDFKDFIFPDFLNASRDTFLFYLVFIFFILILHIFYRNNVVSKRVNFTPSPFQDVIFKYIIIVGFSFKIIQLSLGIGRMGADNVQLPFMLDSIIFRFQNFAVLPAFGYFFAKYKFNKISLNFIFFTYVSFNIIFGSRSGLFFFLLMIFFFIYLLKISITFKLRYLLFIIPLLPAAFYFYFSGTLLRGLNMNQNSEFDLLYLASLISASDAWNIFFESVMNRFIGLDGLMYTYSVPVKYNIFSSVDYVYFFTKDVVFIEQDFDFRSPGFLASFKFLSPFYFYANYFFLFFLFLILSSFLINKYISKVSVIFQFSFIYFVYGQLSEGYVFVEDLITFFLVYVILVLIFSKSFIYNSKIAH